MSGRMTERSPRWARCAPGSGGRSPPPVRYPAPDRVLLWAQPGPHRPAPRPRGSPGHGQSRDPLCQESERVPGARRSRGRQSRVESYICPLRKYRILGNRREMSVWRHLSAARRGASPCAEQSTRHAQAPAAQHLGDSLSIPPGDPGEELGIITL